MNDILKLPSPIHKIENDLTRSYNIQLYLKRDDLIHPEISGNKWRKLKYNIQSAQLQHKSTILTFGGAYSNHITATAKACSLFNFKSIGIIRGEAYSPLNKSLQFAHDCGMQLLYLGREHYQKKDITALDINMDDVYLLPEGGANALALKGCAEIITEIEQDNNFDFDYVCCACGTGTTLAGMATNLKAHHQAMGFAVLKHDKLLTEITTAYDLQQQAIVIQNDYHFNGYAKTNAALIDFIKSFNVAHNILLDYVYTGKMMFGIFDLMQQGYFAQHSKIVCVHTGGVMNANVYNL
jgi:1-aminocyclopropane-1-carboxylate deaminase